MKNNKSKLIVLIIFILLIGIFLCTYLFIKELSFTQESKPKIPSIEDNINNSTTDFYDKLIVASFKEENYLISPYSIRIALSMLKDGANGETKKEIEDLIGNVNTKLGNENVKLANTVFIKDKYKDYVNKDYTNLLSSSYNSGIIYDSFNSTDKINKWVKDNTDGMINKILDEIDPDFVIGLANAIAIDAKWQYSFECDSTLEGDFNTGDTILKVEMMRDSYRSEDIKYVKDNDIEGIILPYREELEFIALKPQGSIKTYINNTTIDEINELISNANNASNKKRVYLKMPRFAYSYDYKDFMDDLKNLGIQKIFDPNGADLSNIISKNEENLYVSEAIHKAAIDLNEEGTKAAAVTYFGMTFNSAIEDEDYEIIQIELNKPFIYMIKDKKSNEILFFGSVYEPNIWNGETCNSVEE